MARDADARGGIFNLRVAVRTWIPAVSWTLATIAASGDMLSARHTGGLVVWFFRTFFPSVPYDWYDVTHTLLRKGGHFVSYAVLSWLWFLPPIAVLAPFGFTVPQAAAAVFCWIVLWAFFSRLHPHRQFWHDALAGTYLIPSQPAIR